MNSHADIMADPCLHGPDLKQILFDIESLFFQYLENLRLDVFGLDSWPVHLLAGFLNGPSGFRNLALIDVKTVSDIRNL